jgi:hypothetical protein
VRRQKHIPEVVEVKFYCRFCGRVQIGFASRSDLPPKWTPDWGLNIGEGKCPCTEGWKTPDERDLGNRLSMDVGVMLS